MAGYKKGLKAHELARRLLKAPNVEIFVYYVDKGKEKIEPIRKMLIGSKGILKGERRIITFIGDFWIQKIKRLNKDRELNRSIGDSKK